MSLSLSPSPVRPSRTITALRLPGWLLYTYTPGSVTPKVAYQGKGGAIPHANPPIPDSRGKKTIYMDGLYNFVPTNAAGVMKWTEDNIVGVENGLQTAQIRLKLLKSQVDYSTINVTFGREKILGPLGLVFEGIFWGIKKLFVFRSNGT